MRKRCATGGTSSTSSHIAEVGVPGYAMITPYENVTGGDPRFMHWYEMDTDDPEAAFRAMTPFVTERLGADTPEWDHWARHPALRIMYVNTFRLLGERGVTDLFAVMRAPTGVPRTSPIRR